MIQTPPLQRVMNFARPVGGENNNRRLRCANGADLGHTDLEVREDFQQKGFKGIIGAIKLVDQQHRRTGGGITFQSLQQRPFDQIAF